MNGRANEPHELAPNALVEFLPIGTNTRMIGWFVRFNPDGHTAMFTTGSSSFTGELRYVCPLNNMPAPPPRF